MSHLPLCWYLGGEIYDQDWPEQFNCTNTSVDGFSNQTEDQPTEKKNKLAHLNGLFRFTCLVLNVARVVFFFGSKEYATIWSQLEPMWDKLKRCKLPRLGNLPTVFLFDSLVYCLALLVASYDLIWDEGSCLHWKICAVTITLAGINLLLHMRLLYGIGQTHLLFIKTNYKAE